MRLHKVHDLLQFGLDDSEGSHLSIRIHRFRSGIGIRPVLTTTMESGTGCDEISIVGSRDDGDSTRGTTIDVTEVVSQLLKRIRSELVFIIEDVVVSRS